MALTAFVALTLVCVICSGRGECTLDSESRIAPVASAVGAVCVIALMAACCGSAHAFPNDGVVAPVPEALPAGTYEVQVEHHGVQVLQAREYGERVGLQFGLGGGCEVGIDHHLGAPDRRLTNPKQFTWDLQYNPYRAGFDETWFNVKLQLFTETARRPALAGGMLNIGGEAGSGSYVVTGKHFDRWQIYLGWTDVLERTYYFEGIGYRYDDDWKLILEHISRGRFSTNLAAERRINDELYLTAGWMRANNVVYDDDWFANLTYRGTWK